MGQENVKKILIFPGQGSQYVGMSKELHENFPATERVYECGSDILGYNLKDLLFNGDESKLSNTLYSQPAILTASLVSLIALQESGIVGEFHAAAGHSLGEYAALVSCGVLDMENAFKAIKARSIAMSKAKDGGMTAVIGLDAEQIQEVCKPLKVTIANYNSPAQIVIAGEIPSLNKAEELLKQKGAKRVMRLKVSAAFHSPLMADAAIEFLMQMKTSVKFNHDAKADFYSNVTGEQFKDFVILAKYLSNHIKSPVKFVTQLQNIQNDGYSTFIETGPGKVLSGLVSKTLKDVTVYNAGDMQSLNKIKEIF